MKVLHNATVRVFIKHTEDEQKISQTLLSLFPFDISSEKIPIKKQAATSIDERPIIILEIYLDKQRHLKKFLSHLLETLSKEQKSLLLEQKESRLDEESKFYIRLDKQNLLEENQYVVTDSGNCFHITLTLASFPAKRENELKVVEEILKC